MCWTKATNKLDVDESQIKITCKVICKFYAWFLGSDNLTETEEMVKDEIIIIIIAATKLIAKTVKNKTKKKKKKLKNYQEIL